MSWESDARIDLAVVFDVAAVLHHAFVLELVNISDIAGVDVGLHLEHIVTADVHVFLYQLTLLVFSGSVNNLHSLLEDVVLPDDNVPSLGNYGAAGMHHAIRSELNVPLQFRLGADGDGCGLLRIGRLSLLSRVLRGG